LNPAPAPIAYFYCARNETEPERANPEEIMRSILKQLSCITSDLPVREPVAKSYEEKRKEADCEGNDLMKLTLKECVDLILALLETNPATIIIDALDECDRRLRPKLLEALDDIIQKSASLVKVFVSSRDDNDIVCQLVNTPNVIIHASDNDEDIKRFVECRVDQSIENKTLLSGNVSSDLRNGIIANLTEGAQGMYVVRQAYF
jgi:hypothetical protein